MYQIHSLSNSTKKITINIDSLYLGKPKAKERFLNLWSDFYNSDEDNKGIMGLEANKFWYMYEEIIPEFTSNKTKALLLFGNPAPHSVNKGTFFAYEGNGSEHRVWKVLRQVGLLEFEKEGLEMNNKRKSSIINGEYKSPFQITMLPFISLPSTPSTPPWSGVAGVYKLFGSEAMKSIIKMEQSRIKEITDRFFGNDGGLIVAFQKDAYIYSIDDKSDRYDFKRLLKTPLKGNYLYNSKVSVVSAPPSRFMQGNKAKATLKGTIERYIS